MENIFDKDLKLHNDYQTMYDLVVTKMLSNKDISKLLYISQRLVDIKIKEHGIIRR
jgi:hypothetical protein